MATVVVAFDGTRVSNSDTLTGWTAEGATPTTETDYFYQGAGSMSIQVKTGEVGAYFTAGATANFSSGNFVWIAKFIQTNKDAIDGNGLQLKIGSANTAAYLYNIYSSTTYPVAGGWQIQCINPNISQWRSSTIGSPDLTAVDVYGIRSDASATAKAPNLGADAIDYITSNTGLTLTRGDSTDANGSFSDFVTFDEGTLNNRYGVIQTRDGILYINGKLNIGNTTVNTEFTDSNRVLVFPHHRVANGFCGINFDCSNTGSNTNITACVFNGRGALTSSDDTRPSYDVISTFGLITLDSCSFNTFARIGLQSQAKFISCSFINGLQINAASANIQFSTFTGCTGGSNASYLVWPDNVDTNGKLDGCIFTKGTTETHAIQLANQSLTSITLTDVTFTGYNATNGQPNSAIHVMKTTGDLTINITGGTTPSYLSEGATVTIVSGAVDVTVTARTTAGTAVQNARVFLRASDGTGPFPFEDSVTITNSGTTATVNHASHGMATNDKVVINGASHWQNNGVFAITVANTTHYTYTMPSGPGSNPTGTITSTFVALEGLTDVNGVITTSRVYATDQPVTGWIRKSSTQPYYKTAPLTGTIDSGTGLTATGVLVADE